MYVCVCKAVTDRQIREAVASGAKSLADLNRRLGVGSGCGTCAHTAESVLDESRRCANSPPPTYPAAYPVTA